MVEISESNELYKEPLHPYTKGLLSAIPIANPKRAKESDTEIMSGDLPSPIDIPSGCRFHTRCPYAMDKCKVIEPEMIEIKKGHSVACHLYQERINLVK